MGLNLYRGFESLRLRQASRKKAPFGALFYYVPHPGPHPENACQILSMASLVSCCSAQPERWVHSSNHFLSFCDFRSPYIKSEALIHTERPLAIFN
jgi:hypothetical protein